MFIIFTISENNSHISLSLKIAEKEILKSTKKHDLGKIYCCSVILGNTFQKYNYRDFPFISREIQNGEAVTWSGQGYQGWAFLRHLCWTNVFQKDSTSILLMMMMMMVGRVCILKIFFKIGTILRTKIIFLTMHKTRSGGSDGSLRAIIDLSRKSPSYPPGRSQR